MSALNHGGPPGDGDYASLAVGMGATEELWTILARQVEDPADSL